MDQTIHQTRGVYKRGDSTGSMTWTPAAPPLPQTARLPQRGDAQRGEGEVPHHHGDGTGGSHQRDAGDDPLPPVASVRCDTDDLHLDGHQGDPEEGHPHTLTRGEVHSEEMGTLGATHPRSAGGLPLDGLDHPLEIGPRREGEGWTPRIPRECVAGWTLRGPPHGEGNPWGPHAGNPGQDKNRRLDGKFYRDVQMRGNREIWSDPQRSEGGCLPHSQRGRTVRVHHPSPSLTRVRPQALNREE